MKVFVIVLTLGLREKTDIANWVHVGKSAEEAKAKLAEALRSEVENDPERYAHLTVDGIGGRELTDDEVIDGWFADNEDEAWEMFEDEI